MNNLGINLGKEGGGKGTPLDVSVEANHSVVAQTSRVTMVVDVSIETRWKNIVTQTKSRVTSDGASLKA